MKKIINKIVQYKQKKFSSWLEFFMTFGIERLEDGGYMIFIYGWGGTTGMICMWLMLKYFY